MFKILVTGSRDWPSPETVEEALIDLSNWFYMDWDETTIIHGAAKGADSQAEAFGKDSGITTDPHPADWKKYGKAAGPKRNQEMIDLDPDIVLAFLMPGSKGTADCIKKADDAGLPIVIYYLKADGTLIVSTLNGGMVSSR